ncbi:unnamed protein product [Camellia sinensis]
MILQCKSSQLNSSIWTTCPSMQCQGAENSHLGNTISSGCNRTTCAYAGYTNQTILTILAQDFTCLGLLPRDNQVFSTWAKHQGIRGISTTEKQRKRVGVLEVPSSSFKLMKNSAYLKRLVAGVRLKSLYKDMVGGLNTMRHIVVHAMVRK